MKKSLKLSLPFVKTIRIKEARIKILNIPNSKQSWMDDSYSSFTGSKETSMQNFFSNNDSNQAATTSHVVNKKRINHFGPKSKQQQQQKEHSFNLNGGETNPDFTDSEYEEEANNGMECKTERNHRPLNGRNSSLRSSFDASSRGDNGPKVYFIRNTPPHVTNNLEQNESFNDSFKSTKKQNGTLLKKSRV